MDVMKMALKNVSSLDRKALRSRHKECKDELKQARDTLSRSKLVGSSSRGKGKTIAEDQRGRVLAANASLDRSTDTLNDTVRIMAETEEVGAAIMSDMHSQRQALLRTKDKVNETKGHVLKARRVMNGMNRRITTNKIISVLVIILLIGLIGTILYFSLAPKFQ